MTGILPTVEHLATMRSAPDLADWLFRAPDETHLRSHAEIKLVLAGTSFEAGINYAAVRCSAARSVRTYEGRLPIEMEMALAIAALDMRVAAATRGD